MGQRDILHAILDRLAALEAAVLTGIPTSTPPAPPTPAWEDAESSEPKKAKKGK